jgi:NAD-dependent SIR2 family protein deacetylase
MYCENMIYNHEWCMYRECGGPIKPDITFFGESLPEEFGES